MNIQRCVAIPPAVGLGEKVGVELRFLRKEVMRRHSRKMEATADGGRHQSINSV
jgi:hypothetical protein